ncbi:MAG: DNA replication protein [Fusobacteria bacterium]|nr:MAG: DNA replication protein [Fusobacteriota bacterium]KAF0230063.1 MAG: DNA replication [Fusobacteriota bacterium]
MNITDRIFMSDFVTFPKVLFTSLKDYGLSISESFVLLQLWHLIYHEKKLISDEDLVEALSSDEHEILEILAGLITKNCIGYSEKNGKMTYNLEPLINSIFNEESNNKPMAIGKGKVFTSFESEFKRPLSPIEIDLIDEWLEVKEYPEDMIFEVLKVAVSNAKLSFKYIDHILIDWAKKGVKTQKENQTFEGNKKSAKVKTGIKEIKTTTKKSKYDDIYRN